MKKLFAALMVLVLCSGCYSLRYSLNDSVRLSEAEKIVVVRNPAVRAGFLDAIEKCLSDKGFVVEVVEPSAEIKDYKYALKYNAIWAWDLLLYLSDAEIRVYENGEQASEATFKVPLGYSNMNPAKYGSAEKKVCKMIDDIFK